MEKIIIRWRKLLTTTWRNEIPCQIKDFFIGDKKMYVVQKLVESYIYKLISQSYVQCQSIDVNYDEFVQIFKDKNYLFFILFKKMFYNEQVSYDVHGKEMEQLMSRLLLPVELKIQK